MNAPHQKWLSGFRILMLSLLFATQAKASLYWEGDFHLNSMTRAGNYFQQSAADKTAMGFGVAFGIFLPVTSERRFFHFELGLLDRLTKSSTSGANSSPLAMNTLNVGMRFEFWRFFVGGGYGFFNMVSKSGSGTSGLRAYSGASSYYFEGGVIWRVIPEFQIVLDGSAEFGKISSGISPAPSLNYGLAFRFPFNPKEGGSSKSVQFDGFRYPFGFMK